MSLSYVHCALYQFYIEDQKEYYELIAELPYHEERSLYEKWTDHCFPRYVYLDQVNWKIIRISRHSPIVDYTIARVWDIPSIVAWKFFNKPELDKEPEPISNTNNNSMYYFHCAVCQLVTDENGKETTKEIIPYSVRLARSERSLRDTLIREMPSELDSEDVRINISEVF